MSDRPLSEAILREVRMSGYLVDFRGYPACPCLAAWLPAYEAELQRRGVLDGPLRIYQLVGDAEQSGGTHSEGGAFDLVDLPGTVDVWVARQMGADASWARTQAQGFMPHIHGVLRGCPHNEPARYQIAAVDNGGNGLGAGGMGAPDDGPRPLSGRTWREGIEWAEEQAMADAEDRIIARIDRLQARINEINAAGIERDKRRHDTVKQLLDDLTAGIADDATQRQVRMARSAILTALASEPDE